MTEQQELNVNILTVAVGIGVVPRTALLTPWPSKLGSAETPPDGVAASRQRPDRAAAAHCNREKLFALCWKHGVKLMAIWDFFLRFSDGHLGAALSIQTVYLCPLHISSKMPTKPLSSPPSKPCQKTLALCVPTQAHGRTDTHAGTEGS